MSAELINALLGFQPDAPELQQRREYDKEAVDFVKRVHSLNAANFLKGADSSQDPLDVRRLYPTSSTRLTSIGAQPYDERNSIRLYTPTPHRSGRQEEPRAAPTRKLIMEQAGAVTRIIRPGTDALCW